jgi:hypothetical protein
MPITSAGASAGRHWSSISSAWSMTIWAKSFASIWRATIIGMSFSSCG